MSPLQQIAQGAVGAGAGGIPGAGLLDSFAAGAKSFGGKALNFGKGVLDPTSTETYQRLQAGESPGAGDVAAFYLQRLLNDQVRSKLGPLSSLAQPLPQRQPLRRPFEGQPRQGGVFSTYTGGAF